VEKTLFGTDGIRGIANVEPMTVGTAMRVGQAVARYCRKKNGQTRIKIVIGKDYDFMMMYIRLLLKTI